MSSMSSIVFKNDNEMRSHFGIPNVVRYQPFEKYYTIRMLLDGCLQVGDRLFTNIVNTYRLKDIKVNTGSKLITIDHYNIKGYFYDTADFGISYTPPADMSRPEKSKQSIKFRVSLNGTKIGGSLNYNDLGLTTDVQVIAFSKLFDGLADITPINDASKWFVNKLMETHRGNIYRAMAREIQEECTPNGTIALLIDQIASTLTYDGFLLEQRETWQTIIHINFTSIQSYIQVREMDEFCCVYKGRLTKIYYIYGESGKSRGPRYTSALPFIHSATTLKKEPHIKPLIIHRINNKVNNEIILVNRKQLSDYQYIPTQVPMIVKPQINTKPLAAIKRMSMPSLSNIRRKTQNKVPIISSLQNAANNWNNGLIPNWKPLTQNYALDSNSNTNTTYTRRNKKPSSTPSKTGPLRITRRKK